MCIGNKNNLFTEKRNSNVLKEKTATSVVVGKNIESLSESEVKFKTC